MARRGAVASGLVPALACGGAWWWAVARLALAPERAGSLERAVVAAGWGLSLLPVHVTSRATAAAEVAAYAARRRRAWRTRHDGEASENGEARDCGTGHEDPAERA